MVRPANTLNYRVRPSGIPVCFPAPSFYGRFRAASHEADFHVRTAVGPSGHFRPGLFDAPEGKKYFSPSPTNAPTV